MKENEGICQYIMISAEHTERLHEMHDPWSMVTDTLPHVDADGHNTSVYYTVSHSLHYLSSWGSPPAGSLHMVQQMDFIITILLRYSRWYSAVWGWIGISYAFSIRSPVYGWNGSNGLINLMDNLTCTMWMNDKWILHRSITFKNVKEKRKVVMIKTNSVLVAL